MERQDYRQLMRNHAGAPVIIATGVPGNRTGLTATAFCSLSDSPPTVIVCVNHNASAHPLIRETASFSVNLLRDGQTDAALKFSGQTGLKGEARFDDGWSVGVIGAPVMNAALASLECELVESLDYASHTIFVGLVRGAQFDEDAEPMLYFRGNFIGLPGRGAIAAA